MKHVKQIQMMIFCLFKCAGTIPCSKCAIASGGYCRSVEPFLLAVCCPNPQAGTTSIRSFLYVAKLQFNPKGLISDTANC